MNNQELPAYEALKKSYDKNISLLEKLLANKITNISLFFQGVENNTLNEFSHQVLFSRQTMPPSIIEWMHNYKLFLKAESTLIEQQITHLQKQSEPQLFNETKH